LFGRFKKKMYLCSRLVFSYGVLTLFESECKGTINIRNTQTFKHKTLGGFYKLGRVVFE